MKYSKLKIKGIFLLAFFLIIPSVYAYLDPGSGSMLLQAIVGGIAGVLISIKIFWKKIKGKLTKIFSKSDGPEKMNES